MTDYTGGFSGMNAQQLTWEACSNLVRTKPTANDHGGIEGGFLVCECPANNPDSVEHARLIAAAPELLEALETILRAHKYDLAHKYDGVFTNGTEHLSGAIKGMIERTIAKAKGGAA